MPMYDKRFMTEQARQLGFQVSSFEKVSRLIDILRFLNETNDLREFLALKGGTAINLAIFNLPRLSVDIDLDFTGNMSREDTRLCRDQLNDVLERYMVAQGYAQKGKSKRTPILDSFVYSYENASGNADNIKIEINYALRCHLLPLVDIMVQASNAFVPLTIRCLSPIEIFAGKIVALSSRAAARDLYDLNKMVYYGLFDDSELTLLRKCTVFYQAVAGDVAVSGLCFERINDITPYRIRTDLQPMIRNAERFELVSVKNRITGFLSEHMVLQAEETEFLKRFSKGRYEPQLLFDDKEIIDRIKDHPMAAWRIRHVRDSQQER